MTFVFVVLHYMVHKDTIECVESISENVQVKPQDRLFIVVIDNGSYNKSFSILEDHLIKYCNVVLIQNSENLGFAKGNNVGYKYAKEYLKADYIALINNDTIIRQKKWIYEVETLHNYYSFAALGPDIITADGKHQNPFYPTKWTISSLRKARLKQGIKYILTFCCVDKLLMSDNKQYPHQVYVAHDVLDADLHGACLIFSNEFIELFDGLCDKTFLYMEEEILKLLLDSKGLHSLYSPKIQIYHKEDMSTKAIAKSTRTRKLSKYKNWIKSSKVYEELFRTLMIKEQ